MSLDVLKALSEPLTLPGGVGEGVGSVRKEVFLF
jgi:hypothetical protein